MILGWILFGMLVTFILGGTLATYYYRDKCEAWGVCSECGKSTTVSRAVIRMRVEHDEPLEEED